MRPPIDVTMTGAVLLGADIVCDGFLRAGKARVQTHAHSDHMRDFETSKGFQEILLSKATRELLCIEKDADLPYRSNIHAMDKGCTYTVARSKVTLLPSGHMLGSVQVAVEMEDGFRVGYSGDFSWPLEEVISVDALVIDSTYGASESIREYSQAECEERFLELVRIKLNRGHVHVIAHRGTLQRGLQVLSGSVSVPVVGTSRLCREVEVYRLFGYTIGPLLPVESQEGKAVLRSGRYIRFYGPTDQLPVDSGQGATINLSAYMARPDDPVLEFSERSYSVALSNHADFAGTLEYIEATGAEFVLTDNSRGGKAYELAQEVKSRLGIESRPSSNFDSYEWGAGPNGTLGN